MKSVIAVGGIAGAAIGIVQAVSGYVLADLGIIAFPGGRGIWVPSLVVLLFLATISMGVIWCAIFSIIYVQFYDKVPGKGVLKGFYFGMMIWLIKDIAAGSYVALIMVQTSVAVSLIIIGFFMWIVYGLILGTFYKR
jgi:hypothetical protein